MSVSLSCVRALRSSRSAASAAQIRKYRRISTPGSPLLVSGEVADAIGSNQPVVALETTIYTHGFPYPDNIALSSTLESLVRHHGGVPATIGILNGVAMVGMQPEEIIQLLEKAGDPETVKVSRRDLGFVCGTKRYYGGTTIAGTLVLAHLAGIKVFATGGLGGVHRDRPGETSMDISADLTELGRTPMALISSGCKSFLDIPRTLEYLETQGVGVGTFADGRHGPVNFPAFWTRESDYPSPNVIKDEKEAAAILHAQLQLPLASGLLFANPIPSDNSLSKQVVDHITTQAVEEAAERGIIGSANTPYILSRIRELTDGGTVTANRALVEANVIRGAKVANELAVLEVARINSSYHINPSFTEREKETSVTEASVLVAGSIAMDLSCEYTPIEGSRKGEADKVPAPHTSNPALIESELGGVGQNVATACHYMGANTLLCSVVGRDPAGDAALQILKGRGMDTRGIIQAASGTRTAQYVAFNDTKKDLVIAAADMKILETGHGEFSTTWEPSLTRHRPRWLILDANWKPELLKQWRLAADKIGARIAYEPVSVEKSTRLLNDLTDDLEATRPTAGSTTEMFPTCARLVDLATPNELELIAMADEIPATDPWPFFLNESDHQRLEDVVTQHLGVSRHILNPKRAIDAVKLLSHIPCVLAKLGPNGILQTELLRCEDPRLTDADAQQHVLYFHAASYEFGSPRDGYATRGSSYDGSRPYVAAVYMRHHPAIKVKHSDEIKSVNGVGDTFLGTLIAILSRNLRTPPEDAIDIAQKASLKTLMSKASVSPEITLIATELAYSSKLEKV